MATTGSPLRNKSQERQSISYDYKDPSARVDYYPQASIGKENESCSFGRSVNFANSQTRQYQYQSRFGISGTAQKPVYQQPQPVVQPTAPASRGAPISQHQEFFISELQSEIADLKNRQRDLGALRDQYRYLQNSFKQTQLEKQRIENESLTKISEDRGEIDRLIRELAQVKAENQQSEAEQIRILESITQTEQEVAVSSNELAQLRQQSNLDDQGNLNLRKENEHTESRVVEQKDVSGKNYQQLSRLREAQMGLDKQLDTQHKRIQILKTEVENNDQRVASMNQVSNAKEEQLCQTNAKISEAHTVVQDQKYMLNQLDGELGYFEQQNEHHKNAQTQLFKANEYEYVQSKDNQLKQADLQVIFQKLEQDEKSIGYEISRLKQHSDQMLKDQIDLQAEVDALDKHMANLNNQNYCLQKELEGFLEADDQVRRGLDRKNKVDQIRTRVDDVIRRSQKEVETRVVQSSRREEFSSGGPGSRYMQSKSQAYNHSPLRQGESMKQGRVAYRPSEQKDNQPEEEHNNRSRSYGAATREVPPPRQQQHNNFMGDESYDQSYRRERYSPLRRDGSGQRGSMNSRPKSGKKGVSFA